MDTQALKREIVKFYNRHGSFIMYGETHEKGNTVITSFLHPTMPRKVIEVTEVADEVKCVIVYNNSCNAKNRNAVECKTIEDFVKAVC